MRHIFKQTADYRLAKRHMNPPTAEREAEAAWGNFRGERLQPTRDKCLEEQYGLCGYSEIDLKGSGLGMHFEHLEPKSRNPARTFDHNNLILSAINTENQRILAKQDVFGGHAKLKWYHPNAFIHPLLPNCRDYFHYETSGRVVPKAQLPRRERAKARLTIYRLNLNAPILVNKRKVWLAEADYWINEFANDPDALRNFAEMELLLTANRLRPFHSAVRQLLGRLGEEVTQENYQSPAL